MFADRKPGRPCRDEEDHRRRTISEPKHNAAMTKVDCDSIQDVIALPLERVKTRTSTVS